MSALPDLTPEDEPYLAVIGDVLTDERPRRVPVALRIIRQCVKPDVMPSPPEFAEVFEEQYEMAGRPLLQSSQFAFFVAAFINSHWHTGNAGSYWKWHEAEDAISSFMNLTYSYLQVAAEAALAAGQVFDMGVAEACIVADRETVPADWTWYLAQSKARPEDVILAARIGCSLSRVMEAELGKTLMAPPPGDVYLLEEMEVPYDYYRALTQNLHVSDIVRSYISGIPLEYALAAVS